MDMILSSKGHIQIIVTGKNEIDAIDKAKDVLNWQGYQARVTAEVHGKPWNKRGEARE